ncbi:hypothetical protein M9H77_01819 [Catharanthus roseus]|uniref:Uncharacterized protein n=1 Tax=Catharanthus roseus TaxID=4058 RepID=A0ACC0C6W4_CATRO|nr:hypothetical protein M9H77_01819 [Catharanthus roseus]
MGKLSFGRVLDRFCISSGAGGSCLCFNNYTNQDDLERKPFITPDGGQLVRLKDVITGPPTLALQLKPKIVVLKVSMHCNGCARKVEKHISKMEGVSSYQVDLETKMVVIIGDIVPFEVLESVSKVKTAELWTTSSPFNGPLQKLKL